MPDTSEQLHVVHHIQRADGDDAVAALSLCRALAEAGHRVTLLAPHGAHESLAGRLHGVDVRIVPAPDAPRTPLDSKGEEAIAGADVVHLHTEWSAGAAEAAYAAVSKGKACVAGNEAIASAAEAAGLHLTTAPALDEDASRTERFYREAMSSPRRPPRISMDLLRRAGRKGGAKSAADPFWVSRFLYRPVTIYFTWICAKLGMSANGVTLLSGIAIFFAAICYALPSPWAWLAGAALVQLYFILDHVDGEMARYERTVLGKRSGMSGVFYDSVCHAGETAVFAAIALRLYTDLGQPWWVMLALIIGIFPGHIMPWQRYTEAVLEHAARTAKEGEPGRIDPKYLRASSMGLAASKSGVSPMRRAFGLALQTIGFPGYFVTLFVCTVLDLFPQLQIVIGEVRIPYLLIWIGVRALHNTAAGLKSTIVYGRRLQGLT